MSPIMQKISIAAVSILVCVAAAAQEHHHMSDAEFLRMLGAMSTVGTKSTVATGVTVNVNMTAKSFDFTPSSITVNQGDTLVINLTVPSNDLSKKGHGLLMETYLEDGVNVQKGATTAITIQAMQDGIFIFGCNVCMIRCVLICLANSGNSSSRIVMVNNTIDKAHDAPLFLPNIGAIPECRMTTKRAMAS